MSKAAAKGAVLVGCGSPKKTVIYFPWAMKLAVIHSSAVYVAEGANDLMVFFPWQDAQAMTAMPSGETRKFRTVASVIPKTRAMRSGLQPA